MKRLIAAILLTTSLGLSFVVPASGAVKAGASCTKLKATTTVSGYKYTCIKSGNKLVWSKGVRTSTPAPAPTVTVTATPAPAPTVTVTATPAPAPTVTVTATPAPAPTVTVTASPSPSPAAIVKEIYSSPTYLSLDVENCKIKESSSQRGMTGAGFPLWKTLTPSTGTVKWALIPIDFPDLPGEANFRIRVDEQMKLLSKWYENVSEGKFKVEWVVLDKWVTIPELSTNYLIPQSNSPAESSKIAQFWKTAMDESDKSFDFSNIQTVNFVLPKGENIMAASMQGFPWNDAVKNYTTKEGKISSFSVVGKYMESQSESYWSYWAHEFGHAIGLPHIGGSYSSNAFQPLDLMGHQGGLTRELSGWIRFYAGWMPDEKVYCQEKERFKTVDLSLVPLSNSESGIKMSVIKISDTKAVVIESRRVNEFNISKDPSLSGVLAYVYDAKLGHGENFLIPVVPDGRTKKNGYYADYINPIMKSGDTATVEGLKIEILQNGLFDKIRISAIP
jgi:M6 family metalloprotease-like protein